MDHHKLNCALELKSIGDREFEGHGSIFNNVDLGGDIVVRGAFARTLARWKTAGEWPPMLWGHNPYEVPPGSWVDMREDEKGLYVKGELLDTQFANDLRKAMRQRAVRGLSIGYETKDFDYDADGNRLLKAVELWEISIVTTPMNTLAKIESVKELRELERVLRDRGLSHKDAVIASSVLRNWPPRDVEAPMIAPRDEVAPEEAELLKALGQLTDSTWSDVFRVR